MLLWKKIKNVNSDLRPFIQSDHTQLVIKKGLLELSVLFYFHSCGVHKKRKAHVRTHII